MNQTGIPLDIDSTIIERNMRIVEENPIHQEINKIFEEVDNPRPRSRLVKPMPGMCVKSFLKGAEKKKVFVNICLTDAIPSPRDITNDELMKILSSDDPSNYKVPMSLGEGRKEVDKSGQPATVYDVAINPVFFKKLVKNDIFQTFFLTVVFEGLQDKYQFEVDMDNVTVLKNRKSIGTLQSHRIEMRDVKNCQESVKSRLIEEIDSVEEKKKIPHRFIKKTDTGDENCIIGEFKIPANLDSNNVHVIANEDRLVIDTNGCYETIDTFLPCNMDVNSIEATINRNDSMLTVKMPVLNG